MSFFLVPVISAFLLITIVTAAPTTLMGDFNKKGIATTMGKLYPPKTQIAAAVSTEEAKNVPEPKTISTPSAPKIPPAEANSTSRSALAKHVPIQPSRSISTPTHSTASSHQAKASSIIATGKQFIGVNYVYGGTTPSGFDCSGFVQYVFAKNGISLPRVSRDQFQIGTSISFDNLEPGDLVFFGLEQKGVVDHEGIYVGEGQFINASSSKGVTIYPLGAYWQSAFVGAKRVL